VIKPHGSRRQRHAEPSGGLIDASTFEEGDHRVGDFSERPVVRRKSAKVGFGCRSPVNLGRAGSDRRLKLIARFGVGYDTIDVPACTAAGILLTIAP
jgi:lactate dehydrogenase-like 2-hydroxyacid dehydrogenase